jgi:membrane protein DedA with SNARE-associated domain
LGRSQLTDFSFARQDRNTVNRNAERRTKMSLDFISLETLEKLAHTYGYWAVFFGIMLENLGIPLPGEAIVLVGGFLAGRGDLGFWGVLGCATFGAIIGNSFGYWVGAYGGWPLVLRVSSWFRIDEDKLLNLKQQFSQSAAKAVFFGRFVTLLRIFAGPLAGIVEMPYGKFMLYNVLGAAVWASVIVSGAYFAGQFFDLAQIMSWMSQFSLVVLGAVAVAFATPILYKTARKTWVKPVSESETP